ncbi:MAG: hypothetical protein JEZ06_00505 [Anaerolineaceae bacterium]|nr:hypothetical protein [Anaerolineaceae bacterium]
MTISSFEIGATEVGMVNIESLGVPLPVPRATYSPGKTRVDLPDGSVRWLGWVRAEWFFPILTDAQRDQLKGFCTGESADVFINTLIKNQGTVFDAFSGVMVWPEREERKAGLVKGLKIRFQKLVVL